MLSTILSIYVVGFLVALLLVGLWADASRMEVPAEHRGSVWRYIAHTFMVALFWPLLLISETLALICPARSLSFAILAAALALSFGAASVPTFAQAGCVSGCSAGAGGTSTRPIDRDTGISSRNGSRGKGDKSCTYGC